MHDASNIDRPEYSQPLTTALQIALFELLKSLGVHPQVVLGHSSGEIAAGYVYSSVSNNLFHAIVCVIILINTC